MLRTEQAAKAGQRRAELAERARRLQAAREQEQAATRERLLQQQFAAGCDPLRAEQSKRFLHTVVQGRQAQVLHTLALAGLANYRCRITTMQVASPP